MLKIGEFSKLSRVSVRMLRHYDDIGLLPPAETDHFTGYRYYSPDQLPVIGRITALKDMGFQLADIVKILEIYDDRGSLDTWLSRRQTELKEISETVEYQMRLGGVSDPRNKSLMKMFNMINIGERAGSGVPNIFNIWNDAGYKSPVIEEQFDPDRTILSLAFIKKQAKKTSEGNKQRTQIP
ncbi:MAG: MerR family transcriptional regulator [Eubacterium sp.]|nr:MerR family transcriptional regulator [Eubacterium sp.]